MSDLHQREHAILAGAMQLPADQRAAYLQQACGDDIQMRQWIEVRIRALEQPSGALADTTMTAPDKTMVLTLPANEKSGEIIGRYKRFIVRPRMFNVRERKAEMSKS
jgi:hypothetical protein